MELVTENNDSDYENQRLFLKVFKMLGQHIQKLTWDHSLSLDYIKTLCNIMSLNQEMLYFIQSIRFQGMDLKIDYEWGRVDYFEVDENPKKYRVKRLAHTPFDRATMGPYWQTMQSNTIWSRIYLPKMPRISYYEKEKLYRIHKAEIRYGVPKFEFDLNKNALSKKMVGQYGNEVDTRMMEFIYHAVKKEMEDRVNISTVISENAVTYCRKSNYQIPIKLKDIQLKNYQIENVRWMNDLEKNVPYKMRYVKAHRFGKVWIDPYSREVFPEKPEEETFQVMGGALMDEMGLGKTIVTIIGCLTNPPDEFVGTLDRYVYPQFKEGCQAIITSKSSKNYGSKCGKTVKEIDEIYCKTHLKKELKRKADEELEKENAKKQKNDENTSTTVNTDGNDDKFKLKEKSVETVGEDDDGGEPPKKKRKKAKMTMDDRDYGMYQHYIHNHNGKRYLKSRATLIIAPNQLPQHWINQFNHLENNYKLLRITCVREFDLLSYADVMNADFVITSFDFMGKNTSFKEQLTDIYTLKEPLKTKRPYFLDFLWHRVIVDEIHEVLDDKFKNTRLPVLISELQSNFRWCLSGSAFTKNHSSYKMVVNYLANSWGESEALFPYLHYKHHREIFRKFFRRNTEESTSWEKLSIPPIIYREFWLKFSETEKAMYKSRLLSKHSYNNTEVEKDIYLRQLCCHPALSAENKELLEGCTLQEIHKSMKNQTKQLIENTEADIVVVKEALKSYKKFLTSNCKEILPQYEDDDIDYLKMYRVTKGKLTRKQKQLENLKKSLVQYRSTSKTGDEKEINVLESLVAIADNESEELPDGESDEDSDLNYLIQIYGTKMANLISYIKNDFSKDPTNRAIIFSQWDNLLKNVQLTLKQNGIKSLVCKGSIFQKNKAVEQFKKDSSDYNIILLSTKYAASGLDLMEANKVIFIDPIYGDHQYRHGTESQAIGRAHRLGQKRIIEVIRFLIKDTIEEEIHFQGVAKKDLRKIKII